MNMNYLFLLVGLPASGKSTYCKQYKNVREVVVLSSDEIREELLNDINDQTNNKLVFDTLHKRAKAALKDGKIVIYDATSLTKTIRKNIIDELKDYTKSIQCIYFNTPLKECIKRNKMRDKKVPKKVIKRMAKKLEKPSFDEGFDIIFLENGRIYNERKI